MPCSCCVHAHVRRDNCESFNPKKAGFTVPQSEDEKEQEEEGEEEEEDEDYSSDYSSNDDYRWPRAARHEPGDFRHYYNVTRSSVLAYTFSSRAAQVVPETESY
jgi:hypothetical protein